MKNSVLESGCGENFRGKMSFEQERCSLAFLYFPALLPCDILFAASDVYTLVIGVSAQRPSPTTRLRSTWSLAGENAYVAYIEKHNS